MFGFSEANFVNALSALKTAPPGGVFSRAGACGAGAAALGATPASGAGAGGTAGGAALGAGVVFGLGCVGPHPKIPAAITDPKSPQTAVLQILISLPFADSPVFDGDAGPSILCTTHNLHPKT